MIRNHMKTALKHLLSDKLYSGINIFGLAFGLAATILIALYVVEEVSYDEHWQSANRIYRVNTDSWSSAQGFTLRAGTSLPVLDALRRHFPQEIDSGTRIMPIASEISVGTEDFEERIMRVDSAFTDLFELDVLAGNADEALSDPAKIALREDVARRFFGASTSLDDIVGRTLATRNNGVARDYQVAAIYREPAGNTVLDLPMLTWLDVAALPAVLGNWGVMTLNSFVRLRAGADIDSVRAGLAQFADQNVDISSMQAGPDVRPSDRMRFELQAMPDLHLNSPFDASRAGGNRTVIIAFTAIAVLVLMIGIINFTILSTARATRRGRETALRKTIGASRGELISQFLGESFCLVLPAMLVAWVLVELLLPVFEAMVGKSLQIEWLAPDTLLAVAALYVTVSVLGGLYPAFVLSRFRPAETLRSGRLRESGATLSLRGLLIVFQFGVSIALIVATGVIYTQVHYMTTRDPGFARENVVVIDSLLARAEVNAARQNLKEQMLRIPGVSAATLSSHQPTQTLGLANVTAPYSVPGQEDGAQSLTTLGIDPDFFTLYQTGIVAGRAFSAALDQPEEMSPRREGDVAPSKVMLNASASRALGFPSPEAAVGSVIRLTNPLTRNAYDLSVIGVAADTNFHTLNAAPRPEVYGFFPGMADVLSLRFEGDAQRLMDQVTEVWRAVVGDAELSSSFVEQNLAAEFAQEEVEAQLLVSFALLAVVIACAGLYGSAAFTVDHRTKEIGIRKVMGAQVREIISLLLWQFSRPVLMANVVAWPIAVWAMLTWLQRFPYRIDTLILLPLCVAAGVLALSIAWITVGGSVARVAIRNPLLALRYE